jgi:hypothetical protein
MHLTWPQSLAEKSSRRRSRPAAIFADQKKLVPSIGMLQSCHCFFLAVVGSGLFLGAVIVIGALQSDESNELTAGSRTGRIARTLQDGKLCHYVIFDNKTAIAIEDRIGRCDEDKPKPKKERPAMFSWGK